MAIGFAQRAGTMAMNPESRATTSRFRVRSLCSRPGMTKLHEFVGWVERSETHRLSNSVVVGFAEPVIGRRFAPTRWLYPPYTC
jgi:hypothetical protein